MRNLALMGLQKSITIDIGKGRRELEHLVLAEVQCIPQLLKLDASVFNKQVEVLALQLVQPCQLILKLVDLPDAAATVRVEEGLGLALINSKLDPERFNSRPKLLQLPLPALLLLREPVALGTQSPNVLLVQTELLGGVAVVLDDGAVLLRLGDAELSPKSNDLVGEGLNGGYATRILLIYSRKLGVELVNVGRGKIKVRGDRLVRCCGRQCDLDECGFKVRRVRLEGLDELCKRLAVCRQGARL